MDELRRAAEGRLRARGPEWAVRAWGMPPLRQVASAVLAARDSLGGDASFDQAYDVHNRAFARDVEEPPETLDAKAGTFLGEIPAVAGGIPGAVFNAGRAAATRDPLDLFGAYADARMPLMAGTNRLEGKIARGELSGTSLDRLPTEYRLSGLEREVPDQTLLRGARHEMRTPDVTPLDLRRSAERDQLLFEQAARRGDFKREQLYGNAGETRLHNDGRIDVVVDPAQPSTARRSLISRAAEARGVTSPVSAYEPHVADPTQRMAILEHERGEANGYRNALAETEGALPFASHLTPEADLRMIYASRMNPDVFDAMTWKTEKASGSALERELGRLYREFGGTAGRPIPPTGRAASLIRERMLEKYPDLVTGPELDFAAAFRRANIPLEPQITETLLQRRPDEILRPIGPRPGAARQR